MSLFKNLSLKVKLPLVLMGLTALAMGISGYFHIVSSYASVRDANMIQLTATRDARVRQVEDLIARIDSDIRSFAASQEAQQALRGLNRSWNNMSQEERAAIRALYGRDNPFPMAQRAQLSDADDRSEYSLTHAMSHAQMQGFMQSLNYGDLLMINPEGEVIYSVRKRNDFGTNLDAASGSPLAELFKQISAQTGPASPVFVDATPYAPNGSLPTAFIAQRLVNVRGDTRGIMVLELPMDAIQAVIDRPIGLGQTGEAYLLGSDGFFRTAPRVNERQTPYYETRAEASFLGAMQQAGTGAIEGAGTWYDQATTAFATVTVWNRTWTLTVEKSLEEVLEPAVAIRNFTLVEMAVVQIVIFGMGWLFARSLSGPLGRVIQALRKTANGDLTSDVPDTDRSDEIGQIASALGDLRGDLAAGQSAARDAQFKGAAFDQSSAAMMITDENRVVTYINPAAEALVTQHQEAWARKGFAFDIADMVGTRLDALHPCDGIDASFANTATVSMHVELGQTRLRLNIGRIVDPESGQRTGYIAEWSDVTQTLRSATILDAIEASQAVLEMNTDGQIISANPNMLNAANVGCLSSFREVFHSTVDSPADDATVLVEAAMKAGQGETLSGTFVCQKADCSTLWLAGSLNPVREVDGTTSRVVAILDDVSTQRIAQSQAEKERKEMQAQQDLVVDQLGVGLNRLAEGDLQATIEDTFGTHYEKLRLDFNSTSSRLSKAMQDVRTNAESIRGEVAEISNAAADLSTRTEKQAATLEETAAAIEEITASVVSAAEGATAANSVVSTAKENAEQSGLVVTEAVSAMGGISSSSAKMSKIISVIDDIAFQTNLLALNAGVEAARAGDAGRGFAVVASEVRSLAHRSSEAAKEINDLISESSKQVSHGVDLVGKAGTALQEIVGFVTNISEHVSDIEHSAKEQSAVLSEINSSMGQLDQVTQQNAALFEETTAASQSLNSDADTLLRLIQHFRIDNAVNQIQTTATAQPLPTEMSDTPTTTQFHDAMPTSSNQSKKAVGAGSLNLQDDLDDWREF